VLKLWAALLRYGQSGIAGFYEHLCALTRTFHAMVQASPGFEALHLPETNILCFRYTGADGRGPDAADETNRRLRERYNAAGDGWITSTVLAGRRVLRVTIINPRTTEAHLARVLDGLAVLAPQVDAEQRADGT
jgi:L-2,4-diaminobutyrate decarboxylase